MDFKQAHLPPAESTVVWVGGKLLFGWVPLLQIPILGFALGAATREHWWMVILGIMGVIAVHVQPAQSRVGALVGLAILTLGDSPWTSAFFCSLVLILWAESTANFHHTER